MDFIIPQPGVVIPRIPTLGHVGQHFSRSAVPANAEPGYGNDVHYFMLGMQQKITAPNISLRGAPPHVAYAGVGGVPASDRKGYCP